MSLQTRLSALITAIGADVKALQARTPTVLGLGANDDTIEAGNAVQWSSGGIAGPLIAKLVAKTVSPSGRTEIWVRAKTPTTSFDRLLLDSTGKSDFLQPIVSALPTVGTDGGALYDGQECRYSPDGVIIWNLKYSTGAGKWIFIGGSSLFSEITTAEGTSTLNAFTALATAGPAITVPLAGDYFVEIGFAGYAPAVGVGVRMGYNMAPTAAALADAVMFETKVATAYTDTVTRCTKKTGVAAGTGFNARYYTNNAGAVWMNRWMRITPIRVS